MHLPTLAATALALLTPSASANPWRPTYSPALTSGAPYCPPRPAAPAAQRAIFGEFIQKFLVEQNATRALLDHAAEDYIQHNPFFASGRQVAIDALSGVPAAAVNGWMRRGRRGRARWSMCLGWRGRVYASIGM